MFLVQGHIKVLLVGAMLLMSTWIVAQDIQVSGIVIEQESGDPLIGVNVTIKDAAGGTTTDLDGSYELMVSTESILVFSYIGYELQEVAVAGSTTIDIALLGEAEALEEIVVVGYGAPVKKRDLTGSITSIRSEDLQAVPVISADQALQGRAAGVFVQQNSGEPGATTSIRIRGTSSISAGNEPLYVIDGIPILTQTGDIASSASKGTAQNPLSTINPNDIESLEVLKDASAAAIYGARAANGVILITTKRGKAGKSKVEFNYYHAQQEVRKPYQLLNGEQYAQFVNEANFYAGNGRVYSNPAAFGEGTDWQDEVFRQAPISNYELSVNGGNEKAQYAISGGYYEQEGIIVGSNFRRMNFRANLDGQILKRLKVSNSLMVSHSESDRVATDDNAAFDGGTITAALGFSPLVKPRFADGSFVQKNYQVDDSGALIDGTQTDAAGNLISERTISTFANPLLKLLQSPSENKTSRMINNFSAIYEIIEGLDLKVSLGFDFSNNRGDQFTPRISRSGGESFAASGARSTISLLNENTLNYTKEFGEHKVAAVVGVSAQRTKINGLELSAIDIQNDQLGFNNYAIARGADLGSSFSEFTFLSGLSRINYSYKDRYLLTATGRADGSSKFGQNSKWGFFPSASVGWVISEENFMQNIGAIDFLKLRTSYGIIGNESIGPYLSQPILIPVDLAFNEFLTIGFEPLIFPNSDLRWESTKQFNLGLDFGFFDGRITSTVEVYQKKTFDLLLSTDVPYYSGYNNVFSNVGDLENKGLEFSISSRNLVGDFSWETDFNIGFNENRVTNLAGRDNIPNSGSLFGVATWELLRVGETVGKFYGLQTDGIFQIGEDPESTPRFPGARALEPGDRKFKDLSGDGIINADDREFIGNAQPDFVFGLNNRFSYRGFDLSVFFQGVYGNSIVNFNKFLIERQNATSNVTLDYFANRWTPENPTNRFPKVNADPGLGRSFISDAEVEDGSYLRLKSVNLGYRFSGGILKKIRLSSLRIYVSGTNLWTLTNYSGFDPEVSHFGQSATNMGADLGGFPSTKNYLFGLNVGF